MNLTYRGNSYEIPAPAQPNSTSAPTSTDPSQVKLIYRGHTYYATPRVSEAVEADGETVTLIYRGCTYERKLQSPKRYQQSSAINWRYQNARQWSF